jgi:hypothetical protein
MRFASPRKWLLALACCLFFVSGLLAQPPVPGPQIPEFRMPPSVYLPREMVVKKPTLGSHSVSFDSDWWPWVLGGAVAVFGMSMIAGYVSGRCRALPAHRPGRSSSCVR